MPQSIHHFAHLFWHVFVCTFTFLGTSPGGMAAQIVTLVGSEFQGGWWTFAAWRLNWRGGLKRGFYTLVVVWMITFVVCTITTVYDDHLALSARLRAVVNENKTLKSELQAQSTAPNPSASLRNLQAQREIQRMLTKFSGKGSDIREQWMRAKGTPEDIQRPYAKQVHQWHADIGSYLSTIPRGDGYLARLKGGLKTGSGGYTIGINPSLYDDWDLLASDLAMLNEFMKDPELGEP